MVRIVIISTLMLVSSQVWATEVGLDIHYPFEYPIQLVNPDEPTTLSVSSKYLMIDLSWVPYDEIEISDNVIDVRTTYALPDGDFFVQSASPLNRSIDLGTLITPGDYILRYELYGSSNNRLGSGSRTITVVPEPSSMVLAVIAATITMRAIRRKRN